MRHYTDEEINKCYLEMLELKAQRQKESVDKKVCNFEKELERRSEAFKQKAAEEMQKQLDLIEKNTETFKKQVREEAKTLKHKIDEDLLAKKTNISMSVEDIKLILELLNR